MRSKERVVNHGEVFTPPDLVASMLELVASETERIDARFLEPACGSGNFLIPVLERKLASVHARYGKSEFEKRHYALLTVMSIYGIELLGDNVAECREKLLQVFSSALDLGADDEWAAAAAYVLKINIVHGDALSMTTAAANPLPITFAEWSYVGRGAYRRRDFRLDTITQMSSFAEEGNLFAELDSHEIFTPVRDHGSLSVADIAVGSADV